VSDLVFASTAALEKVLDGSDNTFNRYYFAVYHCSPDEDAGINHYRLRLREEYPAESVAVGRHFVLWGEPAWRALNAYYGALSNTGTLSEEFRAYAKRRIEAIEQKHRSSQSLQISLSEGQLSADEALDFYACMALSNGQIIRRAGDA
jgi:hypothetical protein